MSENARRFLLRTLDQKVTLLQYGPLWLFASMFCLYAELFFITYFWKRLTISSKRSKKSTVNAIKNARHVVDRKPTMTY